MIIIMIKIKIIIIIKHLYGAKTMHIFKNNYIKLSIINEYWTLSWKEIFWVDS